MTPGATAALPPPFPRPDPETAAFWAATSDGRLVISRCRVCRVWQHPPLERCRLCGEIAGFEPVSGRGRIFSFIVVRQATVPGHVPPYVVAAVELEEQAGLRLTGMVHADPQAVTVDAEVRVTFEPPDSNGFRAPAFELVAN